MCVTMFLLDFDVLQDIIIKLVFMMHHPHCHDHHLP
jgi:hypothetical protein